MDDSGVAADSLERAPAGLRRPDWRLLLSGALGLVGLAISVYLTAAHYQEFELACTVNAVIDCGAVTHSAYSELPGTQLPVSLAGVAWFGLMTLLAVARARAGAALDRWRIGTALCATAGMLFVLYLLYAELVQVHRICEWCTTSHLAALGIFILSLLDLQRVGEDATG